MDYKKKYLKYKLKYLNARKILGGTTPDLIDVIKEDNADLVLSLLPCDVNDIIDEYELPPLIIATQQDSPKVVKALLNAGADPNAYDINNHTVLMYAAQLRRLALKPSNAFESRIHLRHRG